MPRRPASRPGGKEEARARAVSAADEAAGAALREVLGQVGEGAYAGEGLLGHVVLGTMYLLCTELRVLLLRRLQVNLHLLQVCVFVSWAQLRQLMPSKSHLMLAACLEHVSVRTGLRNNTTRRHRLTDNLLGRRGNSYIKL